MMSRMTSNGHMAKKYKSTNSQDVTGSSSSPLWLVLSLVVWVPTGLPVTKASMCPLPEPRDGVRRELRIVSHQGQTFLIGLGDKEAVEGIPMVQGKAV